MGSTSDADVSTFLMERPLLPGEAEASCVACVILPARNEAESIGMVLDRLADQRDAHGRPMAQSAYEVLLLLNNCTDGSCAEACAAAVRHPQLRLHIIERRLPAKVAHVGTARRLLMDTAWSRLRHRSAAAILSTDGDTLVAKNWISENLQALERGADVVGGEICWREGELQKLPAGVQLAYANDLRYQRLLAELEDRLDPRAEDPMPRHLHHFGASLACRPQAYACAGGLPPLRSLEDVGLVEAMLRSGARLRHEPRVRVYTSGRMEGRVEVGLSGQLRTWQEMCEEGLRHMVPSAAWHVHRLRVLRWLRSFADDVTTELAVPLPQRWLSRVLQLRAGGLCGEELLLALPSEQLLEESFVGERIGEVVTACGQMELLLRSPVRSKSRARGAAPVERAGALRGSEAFAGGTLPS